MNVKYLIRSGILLVLGLSIVSVVGCASYKVNLRDGKKYASTGSVDIVDSKPDRPFVIIANFRGSETAACQKQQPYCRLVSRAREAGAHAVWIQKLERQTSAGEWIEYRGRLIRLYPETRVVVSGVFLRYIE